MIDPSEPWFDISAGEVADEDELSRINIPGNLLPHLQIVPFVFRPKTHHLFFVAHDKSDHMGATVAKKYFEGLLRSVVERGEYPPVDVTVIPDRDSIERILSMPGLEFIDIELVPPNPDDGEEAERLWEERVKRQNAKKLQMRLVAERHGFLRPDEQTVALARVASMNGKVVARGRDEKGQRVIESTVAQPMRHAILVNSEVETVGQVLDRVVDALDAK